MKIYTRTGDQGETGLPGGVRSAKDAPRLEALGTVDELNTLLGMVRAETLPDDIDRLLKQTQQELMAVLAELAGADPAARGYGPVGPAQVEAMEQAVDRFEEPLPALAGFILPAGCRAAATLHFARTVCRRAERRLVTLARQADSHVSGSLLSYLNRLGDLLFVLARAANAAAGLADEPWHKAT